MNAYLKAYWLWTIGYLVTWIGLWFLTDLRVNMLQGLLLLLAIGFYGAAQRNYGRHDVEG